MSRIRGKDTGIEKKIRELLVENGIRFKYHPKMYGNPDFLVGERTAIFCDGDFWHGFKYEERTKPRKKYWRDKIESNMRRDRRISRKLRREGYSVIRLWEHDIEKRPGVCMNRISRIMHGRDRTDRSQSTLLRKQRIESGQLEDERAHNGHVVHCSDPSRTQHATSVVAQYKTMPNSNQNVHLYRSV